MSWTRFALVVVNPAAFLTLAAAFALGGGLLQGISVARVVSANEAETYAIVHALRPVWRLHESIRTMTDKGPLCVLTGAKLADSLHSVAFVIVSAGEPVKFISTIACTRVIAVQILAYSVSARSVVTFVNVDACSPVLADRKSGVAVANEPTGRVLALAIAANVGVSGKLGALVHIFALHRFPVILVSRVTNASIGAFQVDALLDGIGQATPVNVLTFVFVFATLQIVTLNKAGFALTRKRADMIFALSVSACARNLGAFVNVDTDAVFLRETIATNTVVAAVGVDAFGEARAFDIFVFAFVYVFANKMLLDQL